MKYKTIIVFFLLIIVGISSYFAFNRQKVANTKGKKLEESKITIQDLAPKIPEKLDIQARMQKKVGISEKLLKNLRPSTKKIEFSVKPTEDFYEAAQENEYDLKKTVDAINLKKPPVQGKMTINF